jgi:beta-lactamase class D
MLVTVEEDGGAVTKKSQIITEKQVTQALINPYGQTANIKKVTADFDMSMQNHFSHRELSPTHTEGQVSMPSVGNNEFSRNFSMSPNRIPMNKLLSNSEISENPVMKRLSLHTYHIRNKNGNPTAQVTILKDGDEIGIIDEPNDSVSQSTTKVSGFHQKSKI